MGIPNESQVEGSTSMITILASHPYISILAIVVVYCTFTRVQSGSQAQYKEVHTASSVPRRVPVVPYWLPGIGHTISFGLGFFTYLEQLAISIPSGIFALKIGGGTHNVIVSPSLARELLNRTSIPMTNDDFVWRILEKVFGDQGLHRAWDAKDPKIVEGLTKVLHELMKEPFLSNAIAGTVQSVEQKTWNLISGNTSWVDHAPWERAAQVEIVSSQPKDGSFVAEADLFALSRDFLADIATTVLMGRAFVENNPTALEDTWLLDSKLHLMMAGIPWWLIPGGPPVIGARERLTNAVAEHHQALADSLDGKDPGYRYNDLSDVSDLIWNRVKAYRAIGSPPRGYATGDVTLLWVMNVNVNPTVFWLLYFVYSRPDLLAELRTELAPYVQVQREQGLSSGSIAPAPTLKIDINSLMTRCPLLKGAFYETMRLVVAASTFRTALDDFTLTESKDDAARYGKSQPEKYLIKKGDIINIPYIVQQKSSLYYDNPEEFDARRFWVHKKKKSPRETDDEKKEGTREEEDTVSVEYGNLRPWGGGKTMCKGRNFAEREVSSLVAAIVMVWDMEPADKSKGWQHPGYKVTAGTFTPKKDIRVKMWRRKGI